MHAHPITEQLTDLRRAARIDRALIATWAGFEVSQLWEWEAGAHTPSAPVLNVWASALGCAVAIQPYGGLPMLGVDPVAALTAVRRRRGLSQRKVAAGTGFTNLQVSMWERGRTTPGLGTLAMWADALGCDLVLVPAVLAVAA